MARGCIPKKALVRAANVMNDIKGAEEFDPEISEALTNVCNATRMEVHTNCRVVRVEGERGDFTVTAATPEGERPFRAEMVMLSAGRAPNLEGAALDKAGVRYTKRGIEVDEYLRTNVPHIYAAGDVPGRELEPLRHG